MRDRERQRETETKRDRVGGRESARESKAKVGAEKNNKEREF